MDRDIKKAADSAGFIVDDLSAAHRKMCGTNPIGAILIQKLLADAARLKADICQVMSVCDD